jgi:hypothetical protein
MDTVSGFDLRSLNAYRWHPQAAKIDLNGEPHRVLSAGAYTRPHLSST